MKEYILFVLFIALKIKSGFSAPNVGFIINPNKTRSIINFEFSFKKLNLQKNSQILLTILNYDFQMIFPDVKIYSKCSFSNQIDQNNQTNNSILFTLNNPCEEDTVLVFGKFLHKTIGTIKPVFVKINNENGELISEYNFTKEINPSKKNFSNSYSFYFLFRKQNQIRKQQNLYKN